MPVSFAAGTKEESHVRNDETLHQTWMSTHCTFPMPSMEEEEEEEVPLRTVFDLLDRDGSKTIDVPELCTILQALTTRGDIPLAKLLHCFPTCVLRPRDAEDERRLLAMISAAPPETNLDFETFSKRWETMPDDLNHDVDSAVRRVVEKSSFDRVARPEAADRSFSPTSSSSSTRDGEISTEEDEEDETRGGKKCSFRRRNLRRAGSVHADWEIDGSEVNVGKSLGAGKFGVVKEATWRGAPVAVKLLRTSTTDDDAKFRFDREACLLANMRHPNILMFLGAVISPSGIMVVTERLDFSLHDFIHDDGDAASSKKTTASTWYSICEQICRGLNYLHLSDPPVIHRDIKPKNILIRSPMQVKIADFGISIAQESEHGQIIGLVGTLPYMSPELLRNEAYTEKVDVFSFAMVAYEILTRSRPAVEDGDFPAPMRIILSVGIHGQRPRLPDDAPTEITNIIRSAWAQDPDKRPSVEQLLAYIQKSRASSLSNMEN